MNNYRCIYLISAMILSLFIKVHAQKKLLALSKGDHVLVIFDPMSFQELKRIPVLMNEEWELSKAMDEQEQD